MIEKLASCLTDLDLLAPYPAPVCLVLTAFSSAAVPSPHWSFRGIFCSACGSSQNCLTAAIPASAAFQAPMLCQLHLTRRCIQVKVIFAVVKQLKQLQRKPRKNSEASRRFETMTSAILVRCSTNWAMDREPCWKRVFSGLSLQLLISCFTSAKITFTRIAMSIVICIGKAHVSNKSKGNFQECSQSWWRLPEPQGVAEE